MEAFLYLDARRDVILLAGLGGVGAIVKQIAVSEIESYCRMVGIEDRRRRDEMLYYVGILDDDAVKRHRAAAEKKTIADEDG
jgi:hypothetical protein